MARLSLVFLGTFQASLDEKLITEFEADKVRALLAYLAVEADRPHRRDALTGLLWPDWPDQSARTSLRNALANLRGAIDDRKASPPYLHISRETIQFNLESDHWLDVAAFISLIAGDDVETLEEGLDLYKGGFLEGFHLKDNSVFEEWLLLTRERLQRQASAALRQIIDVFQERGDFEKASEFAWRQVELEPWYEEGHQQLMRLLALSGQRSAALAQYDVCRSQLALELGVELAPETTRLYEQIRDGEFALTEQATFADIPPTPGTPPYKGLHYFGAADAGLFFGREMVTARLVSQLDPAKGHRFLAVVGASGSGKSSIVRAGLIPGLQHEQPLADGTVPPEGCSNWPVYVLTPTAHPLEALAISLTQEVESLTVTTTLIDDLARDARSLNLHLRRMLPENAEHMLMVVDQFEELFTQCRDIGERQAFVDNLMTAVSAEGPAMIVIALRADFYAHCGDYSDLRQALEKQQVYIGPMSTADLRRAVTEPARLGDWTFEPGLVDLMLDEVEHEPGALPLLSHALLETWQHRRGRMLTLAGYTESGGVRGAIAHTAEQVLQSLEPDQQHIARNIFLRLTELGESTQETRRRAKLSELIQGPDEAGATEQVLKKLVDARLVITGQENAEVAHEALIREWPTLRAWLEEDQEGLRMHRHLTEAAQEWERLDRDAGELYRGARLAAATERFSTHPDALNPLETEFLAESQELVAQKEREREAQQERELAAAQQVAEVERQRAEEQTRAARRLRSRAIWLTSASLIAVLFAVIAFIAYSNAQREADINHSMALALSAEEAYRNGYADLAMALAMEAVDLDQPPPAAERALTTVALGAGTRADLYGHDYAVHDADFSPNSKLAISGGCGEQSSDGRCIKGELIVWDLETVSERNRLVGHTGSIYGLDISPDGRTVLTASEDGNLILWDLETGEILRTFEGHKGGVRDVSFSPDGLTTVSGSEDGELILWDAVTGDIIHRFEGHSDVVDSVEFSPDGSSVLSASTDTNLILSDVVTGEAICRLKGHTDNVLDGAYLPNGGYVLSSGNDMTLRKWDTETCQEERQWVFPSPPVNIAITPNGKTAVFNIDYELRLWDIDRWQPSGRLMGHQKWFTMNFVEISPDGRMVLSGSPDGSLRLWNMAGQADLRHFETSGEPLFGVDLHPDGESILVGGGAGDAYLRDIEDGQVSHQLPGEGYPVNPAGVVISPDGRYALVACEDVFGESGASSLVLWDLETGEELRRFEEHITYTRSAAFSPDGRYVLSGSQSLEGEPMGDLILWEVKTGDLIRRFETNEDIAGIAFSADGKRAVTGSAYFLSVVLWDVSTGKEIRRFEGHEGQVFAVDFSPDQQAVLSSANDGSLILWDIESGAILRRYLGHDRGVWSFDISSDGRTIISSSEDSTIILWDFESGQELRRFSGHKAWAPDVAFHPDGQTAYSVSLDGSLIEWQVAAWTLEELLDWVRANRYVRELTCEERAQYGIQPLCE